MSLNYVLGWTVGLLALQVAFAAWRAPGHRRTAPIVVQGAVLAVLGIGIAVAPAYAGFAAAAAFCLLSLLPALAGQAAARLVARQRYDRARPLLRLATLAAGSGAREQRPIVAALALVHQGRRDDARRALEALARGETRGARLARTFLYRMDARWEDLRRWVEAHPQREELLHDLDVRAAYVSSLGETGDVVAMARELARVEAQASRFVSPHLTLMRLATAAMLGRRDIVERLVQTPVVRRRVPPGVEAFWLATADQAAGRTDEARIALERLHAGGQPILRAAVDRRLARPLAPVADLDPATRAFLDGLAREVLHETRLAPHARASDARPVVTYALLAVLALVFVCELPGGSTDPENLYRLGALVVPLAVLHGEWWRLATATLLHYGAVHLALNMLGLLVLGRWLERLVGSLAYAFVYAFSGIGSSFAVLVLATLSGAAPEFFLGASGAIMGILGATAAVHLRIGRSEDSAFVRRSLRAMLVQVGLQTCFDLATPDVSMAGHLSGVVLGFLAGTVVPIAPRATSLDAGPLAVKVVPS
jgi:rhomboid protease GluP